MSPAERVLAKLLHVEEGYVVWYQVTPTQWRLLVEVGGVNLDREEYDTLVRISRTVGRRPGHQHELNPPRTESSP